MAWTEQMFSMLRSPVRALAVVAATTLALGACGGGAGGEGEGGTSTGGSASSGVASISLLKSSPTLDSDGSQSLVLTATAKSATNAALSNQIVTLSTTDPGMTLSPARLLTDQNGSAEFTVRTTSKTNRTATIVAQSGSVTRSTTVQIVGTTVSVSGPTAVELGKSATFTIAVRDSNGDPVDDSPVVVSSANGNSISPSTSVTDAQGHATFSMVASVSGDDTLSAVSSGAQSILPVAVSTTGIAITSSAAPGHEVVVDQPATLTVTLAQNGVPGVGQTVTLTPTRGTLGAATVVTDAAGQASTTITSSVAGPSVITASAPDGTS
ncbi:MAG: Ig-like domain-containing protein, partial [Burkholderiales bacterium]